MAAGNCAAVMRGGGDVASRQRPGDGVEIFVRRIPQWQLHRGVAVEGEVLYPGTYVIDEGEETLVTYRVLVGAVVFLLWFAIVALAVWHVAGLGWALLSLIVQPVWAFAALAGGERRQQAFETARRFFLRHRGRPRLEVLRERQRGRAQRLDALFARAAALIS